jgi:hypothetical protein
MKLFERLPPYEDRCAATRRARPLGIKGGTLLAFANEGCNFISSLEVSAAIR